MHVQMTNDPNDCFLPYSYSDVLSLLVKDNKKNQRMMAPFIPIFMEHVGIRDLNVVGCIRAIIEGNLKICSDARSLIQSLIRANITYGRRARWLNCIEIFVECNGKPIPKNQELVLRLLLDEKDILLDFTCDYSLGSKNLQIPQGISGSDSRRGKNRVQLMIEQDHTLPIRSLVKYHMTAMRLLGMCAAGKNQTCKETCSQIPEISLQKCIDQYLDLHRMSDGTKIGIRKSIDLDANSIDLDAIFYVQRPFVRIITNVYLTSCESKHFKAARRWWPETAYTRQDSRMPNLKPMSIENVEILQSVMEGFIQCLSLLNTRLERLETVPNTTQGLDDSFGSDLSLHMGLALQIIESLSTFILKKDELCPRGVLTEHDLLFEELKKIMQPCHEQLHRFKLEDHVKALRDLKFSLHLNYPEAQIRPEDEDDDRDISLEKLYLDGWRDFAARVALELNIDPNPDRSMAGSIRDLVPVFGKNKEHLKTLIDVTGGVNLDPNLQLTGLQIITAIMFLQPNNKSMGDGMRHRQWWRFLRKQEPVSGFLQELQDEFVQLGAVQTIITCVRSTESEAARLAALRLAVILLSDGRQSVQDQFYKELSCASSQAFCEQLRGILERGALLLRDADPVHQPKGEVQQVFCIIKMMRRLCENQHRPLQDILRLQRLNRLSVNLLREAFAPLSEMVNSVKESIEKGERDLAEGVLNSFEMFAEAMSGANYANQMELAAKRDGDGVPSLFDLANRALNRMQFVSTLVTSKASWKRNKRFSSVAPADMDTEHEWRALCCRLKNSVIHCLQAFLEGATPSSHVPQQMLISVPLSLSLSLSYLHILHVDGTTILIWHTCRFTGTR